MHLLYVDESGSVADPSQKFFVLAGVSVFERTTHWVEQRLNEVASRFDPQQPHSIELHGSPMRGGRDEWRNFPLADRVAAMKDCLQYGIVDYKTKGVNVFAAVIEKQALQGQDPVEHAFECLTSRFDLFLKRLFTKHRDAQRGMMIFDKSSTEQRIQTLAREFKYSGHANGTTKNYAEVPVFMDSRASRLIQLADLVSFSLFRSYERGDHELLNVIRDCFDKEGAVEHGLYVKLAGQQTP
jgi:hypothetical protein